MIYLFPLLWKMATKYLLEQFPNATTKKQILRHFFWKQTLKYSSHNIARLRSLVIQRNYSYYQKY